jgi:dTDP-4-dehydrorhamnose reductase
MKVLVLGASGMLGHQVVRRLTEDCAVVASVRTRGEHWRRHPAFRDLRRLNIVDGLDVAHFGDVEKLLREAAPDAIVNCVGLVKQKLEGCSSAAIIRTNALFPQELAEVCAARGIRLVHISTDCVFSGRNGKYSEASIPDAEDAYGRSKVLGEPSSVGCMTLRTSMVGWELEGRVGLLEWFASQRGRAVRGYSRAVFSGLVTPVLAAAIAAVLRSFPALEGLFHIASEPISKYHLLGQIREQLGWADITLDEDSSFQCDRSLSAQRFHVATGWQPPPWPQQVEMLAREWSVYQTWRHTHD